MMLSMHQFYYCCCYNYYFLFFRHERADRKDYVIIFLVLYCAPYYFYIHNIRGHFAKFCHSGDKWPTQIIGTQSPQRARMSSAQNYIQAACYTVALQGSSLVGLQCSTLQVPFYTMQRVNTVFNWYCSRWTPQGGTGPAMNHDDSVVYIFFQLCSNRQVQRETHQVSVPLTGHVSPSQVEVISSQHKIMHYCTRVVLSLDFISISTSTVFAVCVYLFFKFTCFHAISTSDF